MILTVGTSFAQLVPILFSPILSRLFSPKEFGLLAVVSSITAIISVISTGKYETAILITKDKRDAAHVISISLIISFFVSIISLIVFLFFSETLISILNQPRLEHWIFICPLISFFISIYQCYNEWCVKNSKFVQLSYNKIINSSSITFSNLFFGFSRIIDGGLIFGELFGRFTTAFIAVFSIIKSDLIYFKQISLSRLFYLIKRFRECPLYILPAQLLNTIAGQVTVLMISAFFTESEVGYYSWTIMVLSVPASIISLTIRDVFRQRANEEFKKNKNSIAIYIKTVKFLSIISFIIFGILFIILPTLFSFVFGAQWKMAGEFGRILCPTIMISFIAESVSGMFIVAEKMREALFWQILFFGVTVFSLWIGFVVFRDIKSVLFCYMIGRSFVFLINLSMTYRFAKG